MSTKHLFLSLLMLAFWVPAQAQCDLDHTVKVESSAKGTDSFKIILKLKTPGTGVTLKIYEIMDPKFPLIAEKSVESMPSPTEIEFHGLKKGTYSIIAYWNDCTHTIGGIQGIRIDKTSKE